MKVADINGFLERLERTLDEDASLANAVARVVPVTHGFTFTTPEEFESRACDVVSEWLPELGGKKFHLRMHRRGFKSKLSSQHEEQFLDHFVLEKLQEAPGNRPRSTSTIPTSSSWSRRSARKRGFPAGRGSSCASTSCSRLISHGRIAAANQGVVHAV